MKTMRFLLAAMLTLSPALASGQTTASASDAGTWSGPAGNLETFSRTAMIDSDGSVAGYAQNLYLYDSKARPVKRVTAYPDGGILREELTYNFPGEVTMSAVTYSRDLPSRISSGGSVSVKYSYLADGTKTSSLTESGEGLVYRGPFTYRRSVDGSLALESVVCAEGRLTPERALLYVRDHLGSVRSVVDGVSGAELENSDYSAYGTRTALPAPHDAGVSSISLRDHFTGQEDQMPDFNVPYSDHGARLYSQDIRRWLTPDPLSEKYYGLSVYGYCAGNPMNAVDLDGKSVHTDINGKVLAHFDDGDFGIYKHAEGISESYIIEKYSINDTSAGGEYVGESWQIDSFKKNDIIDFGSNELTYRVQEIVDSNPSIYEYALKAKSGGDWDIKSKIKNGSLLYGKYASPRDAGNFAAGMFSQSTGWMSPIIDFGYGLYNYSSLKIQ